MIVALVRSYVNYVLQKNQKLTQKGWCHDTNSIQMPTILFNFWALSLLRIRALSLLSQWQGKFCPSSETPEGLVYFKLNWKLFTDLCVFRRWATEDDCYAIQKANPRLRLRLWQLCSTVPAISHNKEQTRHNISYSLRCISNVRTVNVAVSTTTENSSRLVVPCNRKQYLSFVRNWNLGGTKFKNPTQRECENTLSDIAACVMCISIMIG